MLTPEEVAFLRAVVERPDDDLPRLIYADWLDERGDPRGDFIRAHISLARASPYDDAVVEYRRRSDELLERHRSFWELPLTAKQRFRRGFIDYLEVDATALFALDPEALARAPVVELVLVRLDGRAAELVACPLTRSLRELTVQIEVGSSSLGEFVALGGADRLTQLTYYASPVGPAGAQALNLLAPDNRLDKLSLRDCDLGDDGAIALAGCARLAELTSLQLIGDTETPDKPLLHARGAVAIARSRHLTKLDALNLSNNAIGDAGLAAIADSPNMAMVTALMLGGNDICASGDTAVERLCASPFFTRLRHIDLRMNPLGRKARRLLRERFAEAVIM